VTTALLRDHASNDTWGEFNRDRYDERCSSER